MCHSFVWERVNFLCRGLYNAVFWIFDDNSGDDIPMILLVAEQCLHRDKDCFCFLCCPGSEEAGDAQDERRHSQDS